MGYWTTPIKNIHSEPIKDVLGSAMRADYILVCHPDNLNILRYNLTEANKSEDMAGHFWGIRIQTNEFLDKEQYSGRLILPNGIVVEETFFRYRTRFWEYGPEDVEYLVYAGMVQREMEPVFYLMEYKSLWNVIPRMSPTYGPTIVTKDV